MNATVRPIAPASNGGFLNTVSTTTKEGVQWLSKSVKALAAGSKAVLVKIWNAVSQFLRHAGQRAKEFAGPVAKTLVEAGRKAKNALVALPREAKGAVGIALAAVAAATYTVFSCCNKKASAPAIAPDAAAAAAAPEAVDPAQQPAEAHA